MFDLGFVSSGNGGCTVSTTVSSYAFKKLHEPCNNSVKSLSAALTNVVHLTQGFVSTGHGSRAVCGYPISYCTWSLATVSEIKTMQRGYELQGLFEMIVYSAIPWTSIANHRHYHVKHQLYSDAKLPELEHWQSGACQPVCSARPHYHHLQKYCINSYL